MQISIGFSILVLIVEMTLIVLAIQYFERTVYFMLNKENRKAFNCFCLGWLFALLAAITTLWYMFKYVFI